MDKPTHADIWHRLGAIDAKLDGFSERLAPVETFAKNYQADRNRLLGGIAALTVFAAFIVGGFKSWVQSWFPGA